MQLNLRTFIHRLLLVASLLALFTGAGCIGRRTALDRFSDKQDSAVRRKVAYQQLDFIFSAAFYEPTYEDLQSLREAWIEYAQAFPESKAFNQVESAVRNGAQKAILVTLFETAFERADLKDKSLGWAVHPNPESIRELPDDDIIIRKLMPVQNAWARYFLLTFRSEAWASAEEFVISNPQARVRFQLRAQEKH